MPPIRDDVLVRITPYLCVKDGVSALAFYQQAFGAAENERMIDVDGRLGHAEIQIGHASIYLSDEYPEIGVLSPQSLGGTPVQIHLTISDVDVWVYRAIAAGAKIVRPVSDQADGRRGGTILDPFGHRWMLSTGD